MRKSAISSSTEIVLGSLPSWKVHRHRPCTFSPPVLVDDSSGPDVTFSPCNEAEGVSNLSVNVTMTPRSIDDHSNVSFDDEGSERYFELSPVHDIPHSCSIFCNENHDVSRLPGHSYASMFHCACLWEPTPVPTSGVGGALPCSGMHAGAPLGVQGSLVLSPYGLVGRERALPSGSPPSLNLVVPDGSSLLSNNLPVFPVSNSPSTKHSYQNV